MSSFKRKNVRCGCCGNGFYTWEGYQDQDQGKGFGICQRCQDWEEERNVEALQRMAEGVGHALSEPNKIKFNNMTEEEQLGLTMKLFDAGYFTVNIGR